MENTIIELNDITVGYDDAVILRNVDLQIGEHDFLGIIGPNGCGKTTLLKVIMELKKPFSGKISGLKDRVIGYLPQFSQKDRHFPISAFEVVLSGMMNRRKKGRNITSEDKKSAGDLFESLGIKGLEKRSFGSLSGGQMQRVLLARALISSPDVLVLDEPGTFVDAIFAKGFYDLLEELNSSMAIILVSHDIGIVSSYVKNIACINQTLYYHSGNDITKEVLDHYECPIDILEHGNIPHRVLRSHGNT